MLLKDVKYKFQLSNLFFNYSKNLKLYSVLLFTTIHKQLICLKVNQLKQHKPKFDYI